MPLIVKIRGAPSSSGKALTILGDQYKLGNFTPLLQANHNTKNRTNMVSQNVQVPREVRSVTSPRKLFSVGTGNLKNSICS